MQAFEDERSKILLYILFLFFLFLVVYGDHEIETRRHSQVDATGSILLGRYLAAHKTTLSADHRALISSDYVALAWIKVIVYTYYTYYAHLFMPFGRTSERL